MSKRAEEIAEKYYPKTLEYKSYSNIDLDGIKRSCVQFGYEQAEKNLGWHSVDECLPKIDEEVIVLRDELGVAPMYNMSFGHLVDYPKRFAMDYNGWNIPGVKFWMPCPKIPKKNEKIQSNT